MQHEHAAWTSIDVQHGDMDMQRVISQNKNFVLTGVSGSVYKIRQKIAEVSAEVLEKVSESQRVSD
jgi:hypothetical protein